MQAVRSPFSFLKSFQKLFELKIDIAQLKAYICMCMPKQNFIPAFQSFGVKEFGGSLLGKANARERRPISTKRPMHLVLRSSLAKGRYSFLRSEREKENHKENQAQRIKFWDLRPYSKIIEWGREFRSVTRYFLQNTFEALGFVPYQPRRKRPPIRFNSS